MSIASSTIGFFRDQWATRFVDSVVIKRQTGESHSDTTGQTTPTYTNQYSGSALIRPKARGDVQYGDQTTGVATYDVFIPHDETAPRPGDLVDVTSTRDGYLNGNTLVATGIRADTYNTVRVLECEENQDD